MSEIHVVTEDVTKRLAASLDEQSILKDGYTIMALFELEQAVSSMSVSAPQEAHLRASTYQSLEYLIKKIYGGEDYVEKYISDIKLFVSLIRTQSMQ